MIKHKSFSEDMNVVKEAELWGIYKDFRLYRNRDNNLPDCLAESGGFEPPIELLVL